MHENQRPIEVGCNVVISKLHPTARDTGHVQAVWGHGTRCVVRWLGGAEMIANAVDLTITSYPTQGT